MILLMIVILLYYITKYKLFYYLGYIISIAWLFLFVFLLTACISVYINLF